MPTDPGIAGGGIDLLWQQGIAFAVMALVIFGMYRLLLDERKEKNKITGERNELSGRYIELAEKSIQANERQAATSAQLASIIKERIPMQRAGVN